MKKTIMALAMLAASNTSFAQSACGWTEVWRDDFNTLNQQVWSAEVNGDGGGNNELQFYTDRPENLYVENGLLNIKAIREAYQGKTWTSARLRSKNGKDFTYGKMEARIKLPNGSGTWPAFWMMPSELPRDSHGWPNGGEIDIMEAGGTTEEIHGTLHYGPYWPYNGNTGWPDPSLNTIHPEAGRTKTEFQTYAVEWYPDRIVWLVNDVPKLSMTREQLDGPNPVRSNWDAFYNRPFHFILNLAIGGWFSGNPDGSEAPIQLMQVDHVAVYKNADTWSVEGDTYAYRGETRKTYRIDGPAGASYQWSVPAGVNILSGQGSREITVSIGNSARNGDFSVTFNTGCAGTQTFSKPVTIEQGDVQVVTDYEDGLGVTHLQNGFALTQSGVTTNPAPGGINTSNSVLHYIRDASQQWDNLKLTGFGNIDAGELRSGRAKLFADVYFTAGNSLLGKDLGGGLENSAAAGAAEPWDGNTGRLARFLGTMGKPGQWHTVELYYTGTPDSNIAASEADSLVFMVHAGFNLPAELYLDNIRIVRPANGYSLQSMIANFDGTANGAIKASPATSGAHSVVANPAPNGVNNSANVLRYVRDPGATYDTLAFNGVTGIPDALDARHGMVRVLVDVHTTAPAGTIISMNLENELAAASVGPEDWQVGRHSFYQAQTTTTGQWETLEFNYNFPAALGDWENNRASAPFNAVDQLIFLITPGQATSGTFHFDNFRVMAYNENAPACVGSGCASSSSASSVPSSSAPSSSSSASSVPPSSSSSSSVVPSSSSSVSSSVSSSSSSSSSTSVVNLVSSGRPVFASSQLMAASNAVDGDGGTRWESNHGVDPSWITVDLQSPRYLAQVVIDWEAANAADYQIQGSNNNADWTTLATRTGGTFGNRTDTVNVSGNYRYVRIHGTARSSGNLWGYSIFELKVFAGAEPVLLPLSNAAASTQLLPASAAIDGNGGTRWESAHALDPSWFSVDLGSARNLSRVEIDWEAANAANYDVQGSNNNSSWTTLATRTGGAFGNRTDSVNVSGNYRYVRILGTQRSAGNTWGYSIWEMRVLGN
ncbi:MAG TPA: discoidin domain-containing protein [Cellvibrio sp.]|nr:discoidin domain-containing protein [Cellvibrio sp.]